MAPIPRHSRDRCGVPHSHLGGLTYVWVRSACFLGNRRTVKPCVCCQHFKKLHLIEYDLRPVKAAHVNHMYLSSRKPPQPGTAKCLKFRPAHELVLPRFDSWVGDEAQFITHGRSAGGSVRMSTPPWAPIPSGGGEGLVAPRAPRAVLRERGLGGSASFVLDGHHAASAPGEPPSLLPRTAGHTDSLEKTRWSKGVNFSGRIMSKSTGSPWREFDSNTTYVRDQYIFITANVWPGPLTVSAAPACSPMRPCGRGPVMLVLGHHINGVIHQLCLFLLAFV